MKLQAMKDIAFNTYAVPVYFYDYSLHNPTAKLCPAECRACRIALFCTGADFFAKRGEKGETAATLQTVCRVNICRSFQQEL